jgi:hypothetical protein
VLQLGFGRKHLSAPHHVAQRAHGVEFVAREDVRNAAMVVADVHFGTERRNARVGLGWQIADGVHPQAHRGREQGVERGNGAGATDTKPGGAESEGEQGQTGSEGASH